MSVAGEVSNALQVEVAEIISPEVLEDRKTDDQKWKDLGF